MRHIAGAAGDLLPDNIAHQLDTMASVMSGEDRHSIFKSEQIICYASGEAMPSLVHAGEDDRYSVILFGEVYYQEAEGGYAEVLLKKLNDASIERIARETEGIFVLVICDKLNRQLYFVTDRLGLRPCYMEQRGGVLYFASEPKAILTGRDRKPDLQRDAVSFFLKQGSLPGDSTIWQNIHLLPAGTIRCYDLKSGTCTDQVYWQWKTGVVSGGALNKEQVFQDLKELLEQAVSERFKVNAQKKAVFLSGGLDSRLILAAAERERPFTAVTFGKRNSSDITVAREVATIMGVPHQSVEINEHNWLINRLKAVWWTDGQYSLLHMHGAEALDVLEGYSDVVLSGAAEKFFRGQDLDDFRGDYQSLLQRERRFIRMGTVMDDHKTLTRFPFYDYRLLDYLAALPDSYRKNERLYREFLLYAYPRYFESIPDGNTQIALNRRFGKLHELKQKVLRRLGARDFSMHDYPKWIQTQQPFFDALLKPESAVLPDYGFEPVHTILSDNAKLNAEQAELVCNHATLELYLRLLDSGGEIDDCIGKWSSLIDH